MDLQWKQTHHLPKIQIFINTCKQPYARAHTHRHTRARAHTLTYTFTHASKQYPVVGPSSWLSCSGVCLESERPRLILRPSQSSDLRISTVATTLPETWRFQWGQCSGWLTRHRYYTVSGWNSKFDLQLLSQGGGICNCTSRFVPQVGFLYQQTNEPVVGTQTPPLPPTCPWNWRRWGGESQPTTRWGRRRWWWRCTGWRRGFSRCLSEAWSHTTACCPPKKGHLCVEMLYCGG